MRRLAEVVRSFRVTGKVQGVYFRQSARREAQRLGLRGYACNMSDGSVAVLAGGPAAAVQELREWLAKGPELAQVTGIEEIAEVVPNVGPSALPPGFEAR